MVEALPFKLQRLALRQMRPEDLEAFLAYRSDPGVARFQGGSPMSRNEAEDYLRVQALPAAFAPGTWRQIAIADLQSDLLVGDAGIRVSHDSSSAEFGLSITPTAQGKGYGFECVRGLIGLIFSATPAKEILAATDIRNAPCLAVLQGSGMRLTDTRQAEYKGELCTEHVFAVRKEG